MERLLLALTSFFVCTSVLLGSLAINRDWYATKLEQGFYEVIADNEALLRTVGRRVDPAFTCRRK